MAKKSVLQKIFGADDTEEPGDHVDDEAFEDLESAPQSGPRPRSLADSWDRLAHHNKRLERRLEDLESVQADLLAVVKELNEHARKQLDLIGYIAKFHEASEKRGRQMEHAFQGVPDVLRTLPSATREQAEKLSEIAARLYEKAQDNTVNALKGAQANHQRVIEELIDKSLGQSYRLTFWAILLTLCSLGAALFIYLQG